MNNTLHESWVLAIPILVVIITQFIKVVLDARQHPQHRIEWKRFNSYGGMPSSHTAGFVSLTLSVGLIHGFSTALFAVTALVSLTFIRDAVGIRWALGFHGKVLNHLIHTLPPDVRATFPKQLEERLGHTYKEAFAGAVTGTILTLVFFLLLR
ncbi:MAG: divergent PAP2 family protein [Candidatus Kerfeldbacteria bacterium]|nr:divergent PAP2 family protein [Candidatus Kerfeldbacteria bacterium]